MIFVLKDLLSYLACMLFFIFLLCVVVHLQLGLCLAVACRMLPIVLIGFQRGIMDHGLCNEWWLVHLCLLIATD